MPGVLVALAILLGVAGAVLAVPVRVVVRLERTDLLRAAGRVRWWRLDLPFAVPAAAPPARHGKVRARQRRGRRARRFRASAVLRTPGLVRRVTRLVARLGRRVRFEDVSVRGEFGLDDPADTGVLYGVLSPLLVAAATRGWPVDCRPRFDEATLSGEGTVTLRVVPLTVFGTLLAFAASPPVVRAVYAGMRRP